MKVILALFGLAAASSGQHPRVVFNSWASSFNRTYATKSEYEVRLANFRANLDHIELLNRRHAHLPDGARFRINRFADLSREEQRALRGFSLPHGVTDSDLPPRVASPPNVKLADGGIDWRAKGVVSPIQDQGMCGSCWAFSSVSNIESIAAISKNSTTITKLSEQQLVDCDHVCGTYLGERGCDGGCNGGLMPNAFTWVQQNGITTEAAYPYAANDQRCKANQPVEVKTKGYVMLSQDEKEMAKWIQANGPASVAVDASEWTFYYGGIMYWLCFGSYSFRDLNHAVNIVGFGDANGEPFWTIRNSWGQDWGEKGYARIVRGNNFCGVNLFACSVTM